ncbi:unnamed protein product [Parajaminaea phylloscopi]
MPDSTETLHAAASYQKLPGALALNPQALSWNPSSSSSSASPSQLRLPVTAVSGLSMSKAGSATVALQVAFDEEGIKATGVAKGKVLFTFTGGATGDRTKAERERETFKERLVLIIADNRANKETETGPAKTASAAPSPGSAAVASNPASAPATPGGPGTPGAPSSAAGLKTAVKAPSSAPTELSLRISLLKANPPLAALHRQTVMTGMIPDSEFWSHPARQALLRSARQAAHQQRGRNARIVDPRFTVGKNGELKLEVTDEDRKDLLEQNDVLRLAFTENVPEKLDEASFWQRYFSSSLYHVLRTSSRSSSLLNSSRSGSGANSTSSLSAAVKPDEIFDSYLPLVKAKYADTLDPPESAGRLEARNRLLDLGATESDHGPTGNEKDWTMRGGAEKSVLPLVRRFNEHSERVLSASLGQSDAVHVRSSEAQAGEQLNPRKRARTEGERGVELEDYLPSAHAQQYEEEIVIEDLEERRERIAVPLDFSIDDDGTAGRGGRGARRPKGPAAVPLADTQATKADVVAAMKAAMAEMPADGVIHLDFLPQSKRKSAASTSASARLEEELRELLLARRQRGVADFSDLEDSTLRKKALDVQGSATEVLRQFWDAVSPPDKEDERALVKEEQEEGGVDAAKQKQPTAEEREAKAKRMMQILARVQEQAQQVIESTGGGTDEDRVATALSLTLEACKRAVVVGEMIYGGTA